jgi:hypothetical protein
MGDVLYAAPPNDHLNRRLFSRSAAVAEDEPLRALLEQLCTDSIYSIKDDFDKGIDSGLWLVQNFHLDEHDLHGTLTTVEPDDPAALPEDASESVHYIASQKDGWTAARRCTMQTRFRPTAFGGRFEVGFMAGHPDDMANGLVDVAGPRAEGRSTDWGAVVFDRRQSATTWAVARRTASGTPAVTHLTPSVTPTASSYNTVLVAINEYPEILVWVNGQFLGRGLNGPRENSPMRVWVYANDHFSVNVDYIQAWQERGAV